MSYSGNINLVDVSHLTNYEISKQYKAKGWNAKTIYRIEGDQVKLYGLTPKPNSLSGYDWPASANQDIVKRHNGVVLNLDQNGKDVFESNRFYLQFSSNTTKNYPTNSMDLYMTKETEWNTAWEKYDENMDYYLYPTDQPADAQFWRYSSRKQVDLSKWDPVTIAHIQGMFDGNGQAWESNEFDRMLTAKGLHPEDVSQQEALYNIPDVDQNPDPDPYQQEAPMEDYKLNKFATILGIVATFLTITQLFKNN